MDFKDILINLGSRPDHIKMEECMQSVARIAKRQNSDKVDNDASNVASKQPRVEPKVTTKGRLTSKLWTVNEIFKLNGLVAKHTHFTHWNELLQRYTRQRVDWEAVGRKLLRDPQVCENMWKTPETPPTSAAWSDEELSRLGVLVTKYTVTTVSRSPLCPRQQTVDWVLVGAELNRAGAQCSNKWKTMQYAKPEEDWADRCQKLVF